LEISVYVHGFVKTESLQCLHKVNSNKNHTNGFVLGLVLNEFLDF